MRSVTKNADGDIPIPEQPFGGAPENRRAYDVTARCVEIVIPDDDHLFYRHITVYYVKGLWILLEEVLLGKHPITVAVSSLDPDYIDIIKEAKKKIKF